MRLGECRCRRHVSERPGHSRRWWEERLPSGEVSEIIDRALTLLLEDLARKKFAATTRPRASQGTKPGSRDIAAAVRRAVWVRDCARCAFVSASGRRCAERGRLEFHHRHPYGAGGEGTVSNIELRCSSHNLYEAELFYGPMREGADTVREASPEWDVSPAVSTEPVRLGGDRVLGGPWIGSVSNVHFGSKSFAE